MNVVDIHAYQPKRTRSVIERIAAWQLSCVFVAVGLIWLLPLHDRTPDSAPIEGRASAWERAAMQTAIALVAGLAAILPVYFYHRRYAHKSVTICSYCRRVQVDEEDWTAIEAYFADKTHATYSHGVCPVCQERVMTAYKTSHAENPRAETAVTTPAI